MGELSALALTEGALAALAATAVAAKRLHLEGELREAVRGCSRRSGVISPVS